jgi:hypothetical protein
VDNSSTQQPEFVANIRHNVQIMHVAWGTAWLVGFGLVFLHDGPHDKAIVGLPGWLPLTVLGTLLVAAGVVTVLLGVRVFGHGGVDEDTLRRGKWYGLAWLIGYLGLVLTIGTVTHGMTSDQAGLVWGATATGLTAVLHLAGSAIWLDRAQFRLGMYVIVVNFVAAGAGAGWQSLILAVAGGGVMVVLGVRGWSRGARPGAAVDAVPSDAGIRL